MTQPDYIDFNKRIRTLEEHASGTTEALGEFNGRIHDLEISFSKSDWPIVGLVAVGVFGVIGLIWVILWAVQ